MAKYERLTPAARSRARLTPLRTSLATELGVVKRLSSKVPQERAAATHTDTTIDPVWYWAAGIGVLAVLGGLTALILHKRKSPPVTEPEEAVDPGYALVPYDE